LTDTGRIRNFAIIAHIDHGKSTLADRMLLATGAVTEREFHDQILDDMDLERERGVTIKASAVTLEYRHADGETYQLNLIDTPGHVDFSYEVSRALAACEGALLLVDATQGVEAQTVANAHLAVSAGLALVPIVNKVDLPTARPDDVAEEIEHALAIDATDALAVSAKTGAGVDTVFAAVIERLPAPAGDPAAPLRALVFDATYDDYRGVIVYLRVVDGRVRVRERVRMMGTGQVYEVTELGRFAPKMTKCDALETGEVGYLIAAIRRLGDVRVGDTVTREGAPAAVALAGYREPKPMVFCGLYPAEGTAFESLRLALERLALNDSSFTYQPETGGALGFGFRCGFLGLFHMEIVQERLEREGGIAVVQTAPNVSYEIERTDGTASVIAGPADVPDVSHIAEFREPVVQVQFVVPTDAIGPLMKLVEDRRSKYLRTDYLSAARVILEFEMPLAEIVYDLYDKLKSVTRGYGTLDYEFIGYRAADLVRVDILVAGERLDALSQILHRSVSERRGRKVLRRLRREIPRHLFQVSLQAAIGGRIIARENIAALSKNVTAKCYGGDVTRKRKLLEKQKAGKRRMKQFGQVSVPQEAFLSVLGARDEKD